MTTIHGRADGESMGASKAGRWLFIAELALVAAAAIAWFTSESLRASVGLWVLFLYSLPSQFLIALVPHEPVFLFFSGIHGPLIATLVAVTGTVLTEILNYSILKYVLGIDTVARLSKNRWVERLVQLFDRSPFVALLVGGVTPVPFFPFRFLVVLNRYPWHLYALAVLVSRSTRFYMLALFGSVIEIPNWVLLAFFISMATLALIPIGRELLRRGTIIRKGLGTKETP